MEPLLPSVAASRPAFIVLIADSNRDGVWILKRLLELHGYVVHAAYDGAEAIALVERYTPHIALIENRLPVISGFAVARHLRCLPAWSRPKLLAYTVMGNAQEKNRAADAGFDEHLTKPVECSVLLETMKRLLLLSPVPMKETSDPPLGRSVLELPDASRDEQLDIDRWHDDGNKNFPDEEKKEWVRQKKSQLREWVCQRFSSVAECELVLDVIDERLTCPDLAFDCHRTTSWRRLRRLLSRIRKQVEGDPAVQNSMPSPWREWFFGTSR